jgi:hypothetical protein
MLKAEGETRRDEGRRMEGRKEREEREGREKKIEGLGRRSPTLLVWH